MGQKLILSRQRSRRRIDEAIDGSGSSFGFFGGNRPPIAYIWENSDGQNPALPGSLAYPLEEDSVCSLFEAAEEKEQIAAARGGKYRGKFFRIPGTL